MSAVAGAAGRAGMAPGAWLGEAGVRAAEAGGPDPRVLPGLALLTPLYSELMEHRRVLRNVGGNLNDVARHANSTGVLHPSTEQVERLVARVVERVEVAVDQVETLARETRAERARAGRQRLAGARGRAAGRGGAHGLEGRPRGRWAAREDGHGQGGAEGVRPSGHESGQS